MLTPGQVAHFETFGFLILRQVFDADEVSIIKREADEIFAEDRNGGPVGDMTQSVQPFFERRPYLSTLVDDDRIYEIGVDLLGPDFILIQTRGQVTGGRHVLARAGACRARDAYRQDKLLPGRADERRRRPQVCAGVPQAGPSRSLRRAQGEQ